MAELGDPSVAAVVVVTCADSAFLVQSDEQYSTSPPGSANKSGSSMCARCLVELLVTMTCSKSLNSAAGRQQLGYEPSKEGLLDGL